MTIQNLLDIVLTYEDKHLQYLALKDVPFKEITRKAANQLRAQQKIARDLKVEIFEEELYEIYFLQELVRWFKEDYFSWLEYKICEDCDMAMSLIKKYYKQGTENSPHPYVVELYECPMCTASAEFPRYTDAFILLKTKQGRCSEWAQVFTLIVRALGYRARYIYDFTDHEWTEVWSPVRKRWIHCDPCEGLIDCPLIYELGWRKELTYIFAFSCDDIQDVTWRYSCDHKRVLARRPPHLEIQHLNKIQQLRKKLLSNISPVRRVQVLKSVVTELVELMVEPKPDGQYEGRSSGSNLLRGTRLELDIQSLMRGHVWSPSENEVGKKELIIRYCSNKDVYLRGDGGKSGVYVGWHNYTYCHSNVFRKVESDWKMAYLARKDTNKYGVISWKFDISETELVVDTIKIKCDSFVLNDGSIEWQLNATSFPIIKMQNADYFETHKLKNCSSFVLTATIGRNLKSNWQHSQLFRQPLDQLDFPFVITINMKSV